jgi:hypothetical protein
MVPFWIGPKFVFVSVLIKNKLLINCASTTTSIMERKKVAHRKSSAVVLIVIVENSK